MKGREENISVRWGWISREKGPLDPMGQGVGYLDLDQSQGFQLDAASQNAMRDLHVCSAQSVAIRSSMSNLLHGGLLYISGSMHVPSGGQALRPSNPPNGWRRE